MYMYVLYLNLLALKCFIIFVIIGIDGTIARCLDQCSAFGAFVSDTVQSI